MAANAFFPDPRPISIEEIVGLTGAVVAEATDLSLVISGVAPLEDAGPGDICYASGGRYAEAAANTRATACFATERIAGGIAPGTIVLVVPDPHRALATVSAHLYSTASRPLPVTGETGVSAAAFIHKTASIEEGATIEAGATVGAGAIIGAGSWIGSHSTIGPGVVIGADCSIGPDATLIHAIIGNNVFVHPGTRIGQDGFGYTSSAAGHDKVPQVGRVVIADNVEIGANTTIDRGGVKDTEIGEGTKIDNLVQIGHNVRIGKHCLIVSQVGISGSVTIEDFVVIGGKTGLVGHITVGAGAQIGAASAVYRDVPAGAKWAGSPARPLRDWLRAQSRDLQYGKKRTSTDSDD